MSQFDPFDEPESVYEAAVFLGSLIVVAAIAVIAGVLWLVTR